MKKKQKLMYNLIIIDASGSMSPKAEEVRGSLKQLFRDVVKDSDKSTVKQHTIVLDFSGRGDVRVLVNSDLPSELKESIAQEYTTRGMTALFDAIGYGFSLVPSKQKEVYVSILTDGEENDSKEVDYKKVKSLIGKNKKKGWTITFMGTTEESLAQARSWGISAGNTAAFADSVEGARTAGYMTNYARVMYMKGFEGYTGPGNYTSSDSLLQEAKKEVEEKLENDKV